MEMVLRMVLEMVLQMALAGIDIGKANAKARDHTRIYTNDEKKERGKAKKRNNGGRDAKMLAEYSDGECAQTKSFMLYVKLQLCAFFRVAFQYIHLYYR